MTHRDCPVGAVCIEQGTLRGCELRDDGCGSVCESPLVCRDNRCRNQCARDGDCPGGPCVGGVCERAAGEDAGVYDAGGDAYPLDGAVATDAVSTDVVSVDVVSVDVVSVDAVSVDAVSADAVSTDAVHADASSTDAAMTDAARSDAAGDSGAALIEYLPHRECALGDMCPRPEVCVAHRWIGPTCRRSCTRSSDCAVISPLSRCVVFSDPMGGPSPGSFCTVPCDPFTADGCPAQHSCVPNDYQLHEGGTYAAVLDCLMIEPSAVGSGESCTGPGESQISSRCTSGHACVFSGAPPSPFECRGFCVAGRYECPSGECCQTPGSWRDTFGGAPIGACFPHSGTCVE